jgi:hypothetical protein
MKNFKSSLTLLPTVLVFFNSNQKMLCGIHCPMELLVVLLKSKGSCINSPLFPVFATFF